MVDALGREGLSMGGKQLPECLTKMFRDKICPNQMFFIPLENYQNFDV
jgi:hypothetical protein